jgi:hypothetical protein
MLTAIRSDTGGAPHIAGFFRVSVLFTAAALTVAAVMTVNARDAAAQSKSAWGGVYAQ